MKIVFIGAGATTVMTAQLLIEQGHEVVIIEKDETRIRELADDLDCGFLHGDGTRPDVLKQADPKSIDVLLCLADMDQDNILASLVGRALKIPHVITKLALAEFETVATALELETVVLPVRTVSRRLAEMVEGRDTLELSNLIKEDARLFSILVQENQVGPAQRLALPKDARIVWLYRQGKLHFNSPDLVLKEGDEVVILSHSDIADDVYHQLMPWPIQAP